MFQSFWETTHGLQQAALLQSSLDEVIAAYTADLATQVCDFSFIVKLAITVQALHLSQLEASARRRREDDEAARRRAEEDQRRAQDAAAVTAAREAELRRAAEAAAAAEHARLAEILRLKQQAEEEDARRRADAEAAAMRRREQEALAEQERRRLEREAQAREEVCWVVAVDICVRLTRAHWSLFGCSNTLCCRPKRKPRVVLKPSASARRTKCKHSAKPLLVNWRQKKQPGVNVSRELKRRGWKRPRCVVKHVWAVQLCDQARCFACRWSCFDSKCSRNSGEPNKSLSAAALLKLSTVNVRPLLLLH